MIDGYELGRVIGRGSFAVVYEGRCDHSGEAVALKVLSSAHPTRRLRFRREITILATLAGTSNVVRYIGHGETTDGRPYLAMELVEGGTLEGLMRKGRRLGEAQVCRIARQLCEASNALHELGVAHCDIKPSNVLLDRRERIVKLADFGLARDAQGVLRCLECEELVDGDAFQATESGGVLCGTPCWMAPEQITDARNPGAPRRTDTHSDVFSLGAIMVAMLAGTAPWPGPDGGVRSRDQLDAYLDLRLDRDVETLPVPPCTPELWSILRRALAPDPDHRFADAGELCDALDRYQRTGCGVDPQLDLDPTVQLQPDQLLARARAHRMRLCPEREEPVTSEPVPIYQVCVDDSLAQVQVIYGEGGVGAGSHPLHEPVQEPAEGDRPRGRLQGGVVAQLWRLALSFCV